MIISIFGKTRTTADGRTFPAYTTRLEDRDSGELITCSVKFTAGAGDGPAVKDCPMNIRVTRDALSYSEKEYTKKDRAGNDILDEFTGLPATGISRTLWVRDWTVAKKAYEDHSADRFTFEADEGEEF